MYKFLDFLNNKKTAIGGSILAVFALLATFGVSVPSIDATDIAGVLEKLTVLVGGVIWVIGIVHKVIKAFAKKKPA